MSDGKTVRGFAAGVLVGVLIGSAGIGAAAIGHMGWMRFSEDFRGGYVAGFIEMANLARNLQPGGWVDQRYPYLPQVKWIEWRDKVTELYAAPENKDYSLASILQLASHELEKKYGKAVDPEYRTMQKLQSQLAIVAKNRELEVSKQAGAGTQPPAPGAPSTLVAKPGPPGSAPTLVAKAPSLPKASDTPRPRKWCRCDGKDPKAAQAERKARAEAEEDKEDAQDTEQPVGKKTPPAVVAPKSASPATSSPAAKTPPAKPAAKTPPAAAN